MIGADDGAALDLGRSEQQHALLRYLRQAQLVQGGQGVLLLLVGAVGDVANGHAELVGVLEEFLRTGDQFGGAVTLPGQPGIPGVVLVTVGQIARQQRAVVDHGFIEVGDNGQLRWILRRRHGLVELLRGDVVGLQLQGLDFRRLLLKAQAHGELGDGTIRRGVGKCQRSGQQRYRKAQPDAFLGH